MLPRFDHQNLIGPADGGKAVRDDKSGAAAHQVGETLLDHGFGFGIEAGSRFVENQDARVGQDGAGDRKPLPLPARELHAALAHDGVVAVLQRFGELVDAGDAAGFEELLFGGVGPGEHHVLANGAVEQERLLQNDAELRAVAGELQRVEIDAVDQNPARR